MANLIQGSTIENDDNRVVVTRKLLTGITTLES